MKNISFSPMNALIKGTASAIEKALQACGLPEYELDPASTYNPEKTNVDDQSMKEARVVFEMFNEVYMTTKDMPLGKLPQIKFLMLCDGGTENSIDGTYAIYKDFAETTPSAALHFEIHTNPHMEEFEGQGDVLEKVWNSFLDNEWEYKFEDYSCGEYVHYRYMGKKSKELIEKWHDDRRFSSETDETLEQDLANAMKCSIPIRKIPVTIQHITLFLSADDYQQIKKNVKEKTVPGGYVFPYAFWETSIEIIDQPSRINLIVTDSSVQMQCQDRWNMGFYTDTSSKKWRLNEGMIQAETVNIESDSLLQNAVAVAELTWLLKSRGVLDSLQEFEPDKSGVLLQWNGGKTETEIVHKWDRPLLICKLVDGSMKMDRPYGDVIAVRLMLPYMSHENKMSEAEQGNPDCMLAVAMDYFEGNGIGQDPVSAAYWMERLARTGDPGAQLNIGQFYAEGYGVERDFDKAVEWMQKACEHNVPESEDCLKLYLAMQKALTMAERGDAVACAECASFFIEMGDMLDWKDPKDDYIMAYQYAKASADQSCPEGILLLETCRKRGFGDNK